MKRNFQFIFDLDGTLYRFDDGRSANFLASRFYVDLKENIHQFLAAKLALTREQAQFEYERLKKQYNNEVSLGLVKEHGIDRYDYFGQTWKLEPNQYLSPNPALAGSLRELTGQSALLSAAPGVWVRSVLCFLNVASVFGERVFTGEPDLRKPNPAVFQQVAAALQVEPERVVSIGDQEETDILPAQSLGMKTVLIGQPNASRPDLFAPDILTAIKLLKKKGFL